MPEANTERREQDGDEDLAADLTTTWHFLSEKFAKADDSNLTVFVKDMAPPKVYLFDEIVKHKKTEDCWPNISGEVAFFPSSICTTNSSSQDLTLSMQPLTFPGNLLSIDQCLTDCLDASLKSCFAVALSH
ncbi:hypothetical protein D5086_032263 [Populus alba]|uniref:Uncharacterized protein n=1 Tax=Populus alba TaxID=43335 RepID=A0ACC4AKT7_POPAL